MRKGSLTLVCFLLTLVMTGLAMTGLVYSFFCPSVKASPADVDKATALYRGNKFADCVKVLAAAVAGTEKNNPTAHYLLANSYLQLGNVPLARQHYRFVVSLSQQSTIRQYALDALSRLNGTSPAQNTSVAAIKPSQNAPSSSVSEPVVKKALPKGVEASAVTIVRPTADTNATYNRLAGALEAIPRKVLDQLMQANLKFTIAPTLPEARPDLRGTRPRGYSHGGGYDNADGLYHHGTVYIAEREQSGNSPAKVSTRTHSTALHEIGHAFDDLCGHNSKAEEFQKAYEDDGHHLSNTQRERHYYYMQVEDNGREELFAELFAIGCGSGLDPTLCDSFPRCFSLVKKALGK